MSRKRRARPDRLPAPEIEWDLQDLLLGTEDGIAWVPVVAASTPMEAEIVLRRFTRSETWIAVGTDVLVPDMDEDWTTMPWWIKGPADHPYAAEMWRLVDTSCEVVFDSEHCEDIPNPYYRNT